uniref:Exostosin GT47 domain-containing protein n=1 Tax=viral metagenome TaxID=1070528 RepID=A0A6C0JR50_9ZZZZ
MEIINVPSEFQPIYKSDYPSYTNGKNMEEILFEFFIKNKDEIKTDMVYLPVFWTTYYVLNNYATNIEALYNWLETLDTSKRYFTVVQCAFGIFVKNFNLNITVFSAGGGGLNIGRDDNILEKNYYGLKRSIFFGNKGNYDLPLLCLPLFERINIEKTIYCSFMGRYDTHKCRIDMKNLLINNEKFLFYDSVNYEEYKIIINKSIFTLAPRGFGYTSFRLFEAILGGSIPIYIWEDKKILPYSDELNWEEFCIIINANELINLPQILSTVDITKMQGKINEINHLFTFENIRDYIVRKIKN